MDNPEKLATQVTQDNIIWQTVKQSYYSDICHIIFNIRIINITEID
jgi:hypothetical protein